MLLAVGSWTTLAIGARHALRLFFQNDVMRLSAVDHRSNVTAPPFGDDTALKGGPCPLPIAPEKRGLALDPILDPNAPIRDEMERDEMGALFVLSG